MVGGLQVQPNRSFGNVTVPVAARITLRVHICWDWGVTERSVTVSDVAVVDNSELTVIKAAISSKALWVFVFKASCVGV